MKKKLLAIVLSVVMVVSVVAVLAACDNGGNYPDGLPVEKDKITFYVELEDFEAPEYASPFLLGPYLLPEGESAWAPYAAEMTNLEGTDIWYYVLDKAELDTTGEQWNNYMIDLGYNAASGLPADKQGEAGQYLKSDNTAAPGGMSNPTFEYSVGDRVVNLGKDSFSVDIAAPSTNAKTTLSVTFAEALGEHAEVLILGGFNSWTAADGKATISEDGKQATLVLTDVLCTSYEYKILICEDTTKINAATADNVWDAQFNAEEDGSILKAYIEVNALGENMTVDIRKQHNNSTVDLAGTNRKEGEESVTLDLNDVVEKKDEETNIVSRTLNTVKVVEVTFTIEFTEALADGLNVYLAGSMESWSGTLMTASADRKTFTLTMEVGIDDYEFKVVVIAGDFAWSGGVEICDNGNNAHVSVEGAGIVALFDAAQTYTAPSAE